LNLLISPFIQQKQSTFQINSPHNSSYINCYFYITISAFFCFRFWTFKPRHGNFVYFDMWKWIIQNEGFSLFN